MDFENGAFIDAALIKMATMPAWGLRKYETVTEKLWLMAIDHVLELLHPTWLAAIMQMLPDPEFAFCVMLMPTLALLNTRCRKLANQNQGRSHLGIRPADR